MPPTRNPKQRTAPQSTRQDSQHRPHPSRGGARGYDLAVREAALSIKNNRAEDGQIFDDLRQQNLHPSINNGLQEGLGLTNVNTLVYARSRVPCQEQKCTSKCCYGHKM